MTFTTKEKIEAVERELKIRQRQYPGRVLRKRMTQQQADYQIAIFTEIVLDLRKTEQGETLL